MRIVSVLAFLFASTALAAEPARMVVFDLELLDMSQEGASGVRADETQRAALAGTELRRLLAASPQVQLVDLAPQADAARAKAPFHKCNGCEEDIAKALGADLAVTAMVQKTSNLILSFVVTIKDVRSGQVIRGGQVDIRGNNDDSWLRGVRWLVRNRLLAEPIPVRS